MHFLTYFPILLKSQLFTRLPYPTASFANQTIIVTGSNVGLGKEAARHLVRLGASKVIIAVRSIAKGEAAAADIVASCAVPASTVEVWQLDRSNYANVREFAERAQRLDRLDAVIQNAGIMTSDFKVVEGQESHIVVNVIAATLLGVLLLPKLQESARKTGMRGRIAFVGSDLQYVAKFPEAQREGNLMDMLREEKTARANIGDRYALSKLLLLYNVRELAARNPLGPESNVIIDYLTPGACKSDLFRDDQGFISRIIMAFAMQVFARTTEVGSRTLVHGVSPELDEDAHGASIMDCKIAANGNGDNVDSEWGQIQQKRWNQELLPLLERLKEKGN